MLVFLVHFSIFEETWSEVPIKRADTGLQKSENCTGPYNPAIPLLGIYPEKTIIQKVSCTTMFTAALFTIARTWKQPTCPSIGEWTKKMWQKKKKKKKMWRIYTMEYYSAIKWNKIELFVVRWMDLESVIQSEVSQKEKNKYCLLTHIYGI